MSSGFLIINKPKNYTSHDVVAVLRKVTGTKKIGHSGTLDPLATGVLLVAVSREATKQLGDFIKLDKTYEALVKLGAVSETYDAEGPITKNTDAQKISIEDIKKALHEFIGDIEQVPPMHSAKKVDGKKLYEMARKGKEVPREPQKIFIYEIVVLDYSWPSLGLRIHCSSGTYIRSIAHDLGKTLGVGGYLEELKRTSIANVTLDSAINLEQLTPQNWEQFLISSPIAKDYQKPRTRVLAFGTFDYLHPGHINYFEQAKKFGDELYVVVSKNETASKVKTHKPQNDENFRLKKVAKVETVTHARLGNIGDPYKILSEIKPHVICLGYDQKSFVDGLDAQIENRNLNIRVLRCKPFKPEKHKSSLYRTVGA